MSMPDNLTESENYLIAQVAKGEFANYATGDAENDKPANGANWGPERTIRAEVIRDLCLPASKYPVHPNGIMLNGARIEGELELDWLNIAFPLMLHSCHFQKIITLLGADIKLLSLHGSYLAKGMWADDLTIKGGIILSEGFTAIGEVRLAGANIGGQLLCKGGKFDNLGGFALNAEGIKVKGNVFFSDGFTAKGEVRLAMAQIGGHLDCSKGNFENPQGRALTADGIMVRGVVSLNEGFTAKGEVRLPGADIGGALDCSGGTFDNPGAYTINAEGFMVKGSVYLRGGFKAKGEVRLVDADIGRQLECTGGIFENPEGFALNADGLTTTSAVFLNNGFTSKGEVRLLGADIGLSLDCTKGHFENPQGRALSADGIIVRGVVFLKDGFTAKGEVRLLGADIGGALDCAGGAFDNPDGDALSADGFTVKGNVRLSSGFSATGAVRLLGVDIGSQLVCTGGTFDNPMGDALVLQNARVNATAFFTKYTIHGGLDLRNATIGELHDDEKSWTQQDKLFLDGFTYRAIIGASPVDAKVRLDWLALQPVKKESYGFRPQPYEQLVKVLRAMGHERDARTIAIAKQKEMRNTLGPLARAWSWILRLSTGYGYETWRAFIGMALMVLIGTGVFWFAGNGDMQSTTEGTHVPDFNAFIYSVDAFLPIVDLHQETYWLPQSQTYMGYLWFHISIGWILTTIAVAAFTGLFKDE